MLTRVIRFLGLTRMISFSLVRIIVLFLRGSFALLRGLSDASFTFHARTRLLGELGLSLFTCFGRLRRDLEYGGSLFIAL